MVKRQDVDFARSIRRGAILRSKGVFFVVCLMNFGVLVRGVLAVVRSKGVLRSVTPSIRLMFFLGQFSRYRRRYRVDVFIRFFFRRPRALAPVWIIGSFVRYVGSGRVASHASVDHVVFYSVLWLLRVILVLRIRSFASFDGGAFFILIRLGAGTRVCVHLFSRLQNSTACVIYLAASNETMGTVSFFLSIYRVIGDVAC